jgi:peptide/nickel transport system substrate-binding protein
MPFEDVAFRRAVATAIPNEGIVQQIYNGQASPGGSIISAANEFWHNSDLGHFAYDIEEARNILRDAGYSWDDDGNLLLPS